MDGFAPRTALRELAYVLDWANHRCGSFGGLLLGGKGALVVELKIEQYLAMPPNRKTLRPIVLES
jgi:hypothetical protein